MDLRLRAGQPLSAPAELLKAADSTVSRYETGQVFPVWSTVLALVQYYGPKEGDQERAVQLWEAARDEPKPVRLPSSTPKAFRQLINAEREAAAIRALASYVVPGLLQTESYTHALFEAAHRFHDQTAPVDGAIAVRKARQELIYEPDPLNLHAMLDEAVIRRRVGGATVFREQLKYLLVMGERPHITVQVMPSAAGAYGTMSGSYYIVDYPGVDETPGVYLEYPAGGAWVENAADVQRFTTAFEDAVLAALTPADSADLIQQQIRALAHDEHLEVAQE